MNRIGLLAVLAKDLRLTISELEKIIRSAPFRYKHYQIPKRNGDMRDIYHPTPELKAIQSWIAQGVISRLPVHDAVYSYKKSIGIANHARFHAGSRYYLRLDFENFFPSIKYEDVRFLLDSANQSGLIEFDNSAINILSLLVCRAPKGSRTNLDTLALSIGAPSSPSISNAILYDLDNSLSTLARAFDAKYSRYADDLYFSTNRPDSLRDLCSEAIRVINENAHPELTINESKTSFVSKKHRIQITGVVVTPAGQLSVGRARKRRIRALTHKFILGQLEDYQISSLRGLIAFTNSIEPDFIARLEKKYGPDAISDLY